MRSFGDFLQIQYSPHQLIWTIKQMRKLNARGKFKCPPIITENVSLSVNESHTKDLSVNHILQSIAVHWSPGPFHYRIPIQCDCLLARCCCVSSDCMRCSNFSAANPLSLSIHRFRCIYHLTVCRHTFRGMRRSFIFIHFLIKPRRFGTSTNTSKRTANWRSSWSFPVWLHCGNQGTMSIESLYTSSYKRQWCWFVCGAILPLRSRPIHPLPLPTEQTGKREVAATKIRRVVEPRSSL